MNSVLTPIHICPRGKSENIFFKKILFFLSGERSLKSEISSLLVEKSTLEARINSLISSRAGEKQTLSSLEKKLTEEKRQRAEFQLKLETERKNKKVGLHPPNERAFINSNVVNNEFFIKYMNIVQFKLF